MSQPSECAEHTRPPQPYSAKSIRNIYECVIGATIRFAVKRGYIPTDQYIFDDVVLPAYRGSTVRLDQIPVGDEIGAWIDCGYEVSELAGDIVLLALGTGMRWGEIAGLAPFEHCCVAGAPGVGHRGCRQQVLDLVRQCRAMPAGPSLVRVLSSAGDRELARRRLEQLNG